MRRVIHFVEPSKIGTYHISLIQGYLDALIGSGALTSRYEVILHASASTYENLSAAVRARVNFHRIAVISQDRRRLILKSLLELYAVVRVLLRRARGDIVFVSCVMPSALFLIELLASTFRTAAFFVVIHGEVEGLFQPTVGNLGSYGFWVLKWLQIRKADSPLRIVVLDDFVKCNLLAELGSKFAFGEISVIHHPIAARAAAKPNVVGDITLCFVGYRTPAKGFERFAAASGRHPDLKCIAIGSGRIENLRQGTFAPLENVDAYFRAISGCAAAVFPYVTGYSCALSAAVIDAISCGVHIIATNRPCFESLRAYFGANVVTIFGSQKELDLLLDHKEWLRELSRHQEQTIEMLKHSKYGIEAVRASFEALFLQEERLEAKLAST